MENNLLTYINERFPIPGFAVSVSLPYQPPVYSDHIWFRLFRFFVMVAFAILLPTNTDEFGQTPRDVNLQDHSKEVLLIALTYYSRNNSLFNEMAAVLLAGDCFVDLYNAYIPIIILRFFDKHENTTFTLFDNIYDLVMQRIRCNKVVYFA